MNLLLDTQIFLWYLTANPALPAAVRDAIRDPANRSFLSVVSVWEAVIKHGVGKLPLPGPPAVYIPQERDAHGITPLPLDDGALTHLAGLPSFHRDPFDRILIAQALQHGLTLVTVDAAVRGYPVPLLPPATSTP